MEKFWKTVDIMQLILNINKVLYIATTDEVSNQKKNNMENSSFVYKCQLNGIKNYIINNTMINCMHFCMEKIKDKMYTFQNMKKLFKYKVFDQKLE